ncbi:hypothetical protein BD779DRAFT_1470221 [Infundibulicybe gibba]|nr:hypothetical protein BD779DRAFT_1470221 [Infundibulicybe gibba]
MLSAILLSLTLASPIFAAPELVSRSTGCDISAARMDFPSEQTALAPPTTKPSFVAVAIGTQNYTCGTTGTYTNVGAVAELFDISCLYNTPAFGEIQNFAYDIWRVSPPAVTPQGIITLLHSAKTPEILGRQCRQPQRVCCCGKVSGLSAPTGTSDIDWVSLSSLTGELAQQVYRVDTKGGQPPATCTPGSNPIVVKYAAKYWLFGGSVKHTPTTNGTKLSPLNHLDEDRHSSAYCGDGSGVSSLCMSFGAGPTWSLLAFAEGS